MSDTSTILIVDDNMTGRMALEALLMREGYHLEMAASGPEALEKATHIQPDLMLLDVMMPDMDGYEVCRRLRALPDLAELPVVMVTALNDDESRMQGLQAGADDFISKPFSAAELRARVRTITRLNRYRRLALEREQRQQAEQRTQLQIQRLSALHAIDMDIAANLDAQAMLERLVEQIYQRLQLDAAAVLLLDQATATVQCAASYGLCADCLVQVSLDRDASFAGRAIATRRPVFVSDLGCRPATNGTGPVIHTINGHTVAITADLLSSPTIELMHSEGFVAGYIVPIISRSKPLGVLALFHRSAIASEPDWLDFLETLAGQTAIALDNAYLFEHLQQSYDATLEGWVRALDLRDKETEGHSRRVTEMTVRLAQKMGMHADDIEHVRRGALLHDIGKLGIPDNILLKPGKLTDEEWVVMRTHPVLAYEWLASIAYLRPALDIPYCHHEKWDGTGYPRGLRGEQIPLAARMFAVVDVWDALSSDRPYRKRWPADKVYAHLQDNAGTHFDPQVVEAFLALQGVPQLDKV